MSGLLQLDWCVCSLTRARLHLTRVGNYLRRDATLPRLLLRLGRCATRGRPRDCPCRIYIARGDGVARVSKSARRNERANESNHARISSFVIRFRRSSASMSAWLRIALRLPISSSRSPAVNDVEKRSIIRRSTLDLSDVDISSWIFPRGLMNSRKL